MILYMTFKMIKLIIGLSLWLLLLPFRVMLLPFRILFGKKRERHGDLLWELLVVSSLF